MEGASPGPRNPFSSDGQAMPLQNLCVRGVAQVGALGLPSGCAWVTRNLGELNE